MARNFSQNEITVLRGKAINLALFVELSWPAGAVRAWSGLGPYTWGGNTFIGVGDLGGISNIPEASDGRAPGITVTMSGIPTDLLSAVIGEDYQNRSGKIWLGFLSSDTLIADPPYLLFSGKMDVASITSSGTTSAISISIENRMIDLQKANGRRYTYEDQKIDYPDDLGLEYVAAINQDRPLNWGQPGGSVVSREYGSSRT